MLPPRHSFLESYWRTCFIQQESKPRKRKTQGPRKRKGHRELLTPGNGKSEGDKCADLRATLPEKSIPGKMSPRKTKQNQ